MMYSSRTIWMPLLAALAFALVAPAPAAETEPSDQDLQFFETKVRPLLVEQCYSCHSSQAKKLKAGLFMDSRQGIIKGGDTGPALVAGDPDKSLIIDAIRYENVDLQMPPKKKLSDEQIAVLTQWVKIGAPWPKETGAPGAVKAFDLDGRKSEHWSWKPVQAQVPPPVKDKAWARSPIDAFILANLESKGLSPAKDADPRTLVRRIYFDLIGLPPTPEQVAAFQESAIHNPQSAISDLVDQLLASPHFGEKWARHWLDITRYAETCGHEFEYPIPHAWRYRDYVIRAFNADVPYNQFLTEHVAGDLLEKPRLNPEERFNESIIGTGFFHLHEATHAPVDVRGDEAIRVDNQIDVMMRGFFGLTVACARCHDHKFDAISTKDFYALAGFLQSSRRQVAMLDPNQRIGEGVAKLGQVRADADALFAAAKPSADAKEWKSLFLAAHTAIFNPPKVTGIAQVRDEKDIIIEDFETGDYRNWSVTGDAFGDKPQTLETIAGYQGKINGVGKYFVNSHQKRGGGKGDDATGTMISKPFTIERGFITLLVGGGAHGGKTCINLVIDGKTVLTATGKENNQMFPVTWDVRSYRGKKAELYIIDNHTGGWGNIGVDQIVMTNTADAGAVAASELPSDAVIQAVAKEQRVDAGVLKRLIIALKDESIREPSHPLHAWHLIAADAKAGKKQAKQTGRKEYDGKLFADFNGRDFAGWFATGEAFGRGPTQARQWDSVSRDGGMLEAGVAHSGAISPRLEGTLRSPTFEITTDKIHYRVKGKGQIRLIIDSYTMDVYNGLLFGGISFNVDTKGKWRWHTQGGDLGKYLGHRAYFEINDDDHDWIAVDSIYFSQGGPPADEVSAQTLELANASIESPEQLAEAFAQFVVANDLGFFVKQANEAAATAEKLAAAKKAMEEIERQIPAPMKVQAMTDGNGENEYVFIRGSHKTLGPEVPRRFLEAIDARPIESATSGRLELARRMTDAKANPYVSRVIVNRLWHHLFGRGIVATVDDFGVMGLPPTHPELLDWLADDFVKGGWSLKHTIKQIVTSRTYRMDSHVDMASRAQQTDPSNELLSRFPIRRLQAEAIRDSILTVSGRLDRTVGGPGVPVHLTAFMEGRGRPGSGPLDGNGRRSIYTEIRRNFLPSMMLAFDFPSPFSCMGRRTVSNVPAQALILMNDPFVVQQAELWSKRVLKESGDAKARVNQMFEAAFSRPATAEEHAKFQAFIAQQAKAYNASEDDPRVWKDVAHVIYNMKEFVFLN
ncbi:MAG: PSD1 and planctomycete cytochrome C domain-containing protein [Phycisphaeraceae bacterium]